LDGGYPSLIVVPTSGCGIAAESSGERAAVRRRPSEPLCVQAPPRCRMQLKEHFVLVCWDRTGTGMSLLNIAIVGVSLLFLGLVVAVTVR